MFEEVPSDPRSSTDGVRLSAGNTEVEQSSMALQPPCATAPPLVSAGDPATDTYDAQGTNTSDVPDFTILNADIVNMLNAPQLDFVDPQYLGSPAWNIPFFFASSSNPQPLAPVLPGDFDTFQAFTGSENDDSVVGKDLNEMIGLDGANSVSQIYRGPRWKHHNAPPSNSLPGFDVPAMMTRMRMRWIFSKPKTLAIPVNS